MPDDYGLIGGLGKGLQAAANMYIQTKQRNRDNQIQEMTSGLVDDGSGNLDYSPMKKQQMALQSLDTQNKTDSYDPGSDYSQKRVALAQSLVGKAIPGFDTNSLNGMSAHDLTSEDSLVKPAITAGFGMQGNQMKAATMGAAAMGRNDIARDNQTSHAVDEVTKDPIITHTYLPRLQGASRIQSQIQAIKDGKLTDTSQLLGEMNLEYNALATGSNSPGLGKEEQTAYTTGAQKLAGMLQSITGDPESIHSPKIMAQLETQIADLKQNYQSAISQRASMLQRNYKHNPDATKAQQDKIKDMTTQYGDPTIGAAPSGGLIGNQAGAPSQQTAVPPHPQDSVAIQWAKANINGPNAAKASAILKANGAQ